MPLYGGIDLHANNSVVVLLNEQDQRIYHKRLPNDLATIVEQLAPYHADIEGLVVESTYNWYWLVGLDHGIGHFRVAAEDSEARAATPPMPKSTQTSTVAWPLSSIRTDM